jgi:hypothetical protein
MLESYVGESEWEDIRERSIRGLNERVEHYNRLLVTDIPIYGYRTVGERRGTYEIDPESGPVVQDIFNKADQGWSTKRIADYLNEQHIPTPSKLLYQRRELSAKKPVAQEWISQRVGHILREQSYTGEHFARRYKSVKVKTRKKDGTEKTYIRKVLRPESDERRVAHAIPALVSTEQFNRVKAQLQSRDLGWSRVDDNPGACLLNKGIAVCGCCGNRMIRRHQGKWGYTCSMRADKSINPALICPGGFFVVSAVEVDQDVWGKVVEIMKDSPQFNRLVKSKTAKLAEKHEEAVGRQKRAERELAEWKARQAAVYDRMTRENDDTIFAMHRAELQKINETVAGLEKRISKYQASAQHAQQVQDTHQMLLNGIAAMLKRYDHWNQLTKAYEVEHPANSGLLITRVREAIEGISLDSLDREEKRAIMKALDVKVKMYPTKSEFFRANGRRWELCFSDQSPLSDVPLVGVILGT